MSKIDIDDEMPKILKGFMETFETYMKNKQVDEKESWTLGMTLLLSINLAILSHLTINYNGDEFANHKEMAEKLYIHLANFAKDDL